MSKIYNIKTSLKDGSTYGETTSLKHVLDITESQFTYKFIKDDDSIACGFTLDWETLTNNVEFSEQSFCIPRLFAIVDDVVNNPIMTFHLANTMISKNSIPFDGLLWDYCKWPVRIFINDATNFTNCNFMVLDIENRDVSVEVNSPHTVEDSPKVWTDLLSTITLSSTQNTVSSGDIIQVDVSTSNTNLQYVYLEPVCGVLDRTRVKLTNGMGKFKILTSTLDSGDVVDVKAGFKTVTGLARFTKTLS
jgi:hypothetical protein